MSWKGNPMGHSLASRGVKTNSNMGNLKSEIKHGNWKDTSAYKHGHVSEVPIEWLMQFSLVRRDLKSLPSFWGEWGQGGRDTIEDLKEDIKTRGLQHPLQLHVGREDGRVILGEGNHRIIALKELGYEKVPVRVLSYEFLFNGIEYEHDVSKTKTFPSASNPLHVFPDLEGYTPHPLLKPLDWKEEYR